MGWLEHERVRVEEEEKDGDGGGGGARTYLVRLLIMATAVHLMMVHAAKTPNQGKCGYPTPGPVGPSKP